MPTSEAAALTSVSILFHPITLCYLLHSIDYYLNVSCLLSPGCSRTSLFQKQNLLWLVQWSVAGLGTRSGNVWCSECENCAFCYHSLTPLSSLISTFSALTLKLSVPFSLPISYSNCSMHSSLKTERRKKKKKKHWDCRTSCSSVDEQVDEIHLNSCGCLITWKPAVFSILR